MNIVIREYQSEDATAAITIWNQVVEDGIAFPQEENLTEETGDAFFKEQTYTGIAVNADNNEIVGLYKALQQKENSQPEKWYWLECLQQSLQ
ncbi:hypothetical protein [Blautia sp.]